MKTIFFTSMFLLASISAFAKPSTPDEIKLLCSAVDEMLAQVEADAGVDLEACLEVRGTVKRVSEATYVVEATVPFITPSRRMTQKCQVSYSFEPTLDNVVGGIEAGVSCNP